MVPTPTDSLRVVPFVAIALLMFGAAELKSQLVESRARTQAGDSKLDPVSPEPTVEQLPAATIVFIRYTGPYWSVGPAVHEVTQLVHDLGGIGPLFIRYKSDPRVTSPETLRLDVGFFTGDPPAIEPPYEMEALDPRKVARLDIAGTPRTNLGHIRKLYDWVEQNSLEPAGPLYEIWPLGSGDKSAGTQQTQLQLPVAPCSAPSVAASGADSLRPQSIPASVSDARMAPEPKRLVPHAIGRPANEPRPLAPFPGGVTDPEQMKKIIDDAWANRWKKKSPSDNVPAKRTERIPAFTSPVGPPSKSPARTSTPGTSRESGTASASTNSQAAAFVVPRTQNSSPAITVADLLDTENYSALARRIVPEANQIHPSLQVWLGQVVYRVSAVASGVQKNFPDDSGDLSVLATALKERYKSVSSNFAAAETLHRDALGDSITEISKKKAQIMRDLDRLMGKIALKTVDADSVRIELAGIVNATLDVVKFSQNSLGATSISP